MTGDGISLAALRAVETHRTGPWPWDEGAASPPKCEIEHATLLALLEAVVAALFYRQGSDVLEEDDLSGYALDEALDRFDFGPAA